MKDLRDFSRNTVVYLATNILGLALPFVLLPFLIRELGPEEYGRIGLIASAFTVLLTFVGVGTHAYVRNSINRCTASELQLVIGNCLVILFASGGLMLLVLLLLEYLIGLPLALGLCVVAVMAAIGQKMISMRLVMWQMAGQPLYYGLLSITMTGLNLAVSLLLVFVFGLEAEGRLLGMWLPAVVLGTVILIGFLTFSVARLSLSGVLLKKILQFGIPLIPHSVALSAVILVERTALSTTDGGKALGVYFAAFQLALPVTILVNSVNLQFRSWSDKTMAAGNHADVVKVSYLVMLLFLVAASCYAYLLQFFYSLIVGPDMPDGYGVCLVLIGSAVFRGFYLVVAKGLFFSDRTRLLMTITVLLFLTLCVALYFVRSLFGVAVLNLLFNAILFLFVWIAAARVYPQPWLSFATKSRPGD